LIVGESIDQRADLACRALVEISIGGPSQARQSEVVAAAVNLVTADGDETRALKAGEDTAEEALIDLEAVAKFETLHAS
jgi:hypothetical protein